MQTHQKELPAKIQAWLTQIESGKAQSDAAKILQLMRKQHFSTIEEISAALNMVKSTVTARMTSLLELGIIYRCGNRKVNGRNYQLYMFVSDPKNYRWFGELYRLDKLIQRLKGVQRSEAISPKLMADIDAELKTLHSKREMVSRKTQVASV